MLLTQFAKLLVLATIAIASDKPKDRESMPFDYFLGPEAEELSRERPIAFNPDDGHNFRAEYEDKYGYRGERLIAMLGRGSQPLSIFDNPGGTPSTTTVNPSSSSSLPEDSETPTTTASPPEKEQSAKFKAPKKYIEIDRRNKGFLSENFFENNIPQETSFKTSPDGIVYKRLYGAIWNYGANGLPRKPGFDQGLEGISAFMPLGWDAFNFNSDALTPFPAESNLPQRESIPLPALPLENEQTASQKEYAGLGEPSIMVQSYSYR